MSLSSLSAQYNAPHIGIIMLNTEFARPVGDIGNVASYQYPAQIFKLRKANVANVVCEELAPQLIEEVIEGALSLKAAGANIITTSCGFLAKVQSVVQQSIDLPFIASSLSLLPFLRQVFGPLCTIGVVTFDSKVLNEAHFNGHFDSNLKIAGIENGQELHQVIKEGRTELDLDLAQRDVIQAVEQLMQYQPRCLLLECTNLSPYKAALREHFQLPVFDLVDAIHWLAAARG
ncbi:MAG: aspartate/glutamate racemase family protein [Oceanospirillaceae bacterium]